MLPDAYGTDRLYEAFALYHLARRSGLRSPVAGIDLLDGDRLRFWFADRELQEARALLFEAGDLAVEPLSFQKHQAELRDVMRAASDRRQHH